MRVCHNIQSQISNSTSEERESRNRPKSPQKPKVAFEVVGTVFLSSDTRDLVYFNPYSQHYYLAIEPQECILSTSFTQAAPDLVAESYTVSNRD